MPYAIELSAKMIEASEERVSKLCQCIKVSSAENIDFKDQYFDKVLCWGVFDLTKY